MRRLGRTMLGTALAVVFLAAGAGDAHALGSFSAGNPAFCEPKEPARDFGFSRLPPVRTVPLDGQLPFARPNVSIYGSSPREVMDRRGSVGYGFSEENFSGTVRLDWTVTAQMWLLGRRGRPVREVDAETLVIGELDAGDQPAVWLDTLGRRGFYRFDLQFADRDGKQLGSYSAYAKVARSFWKARLKLDRRVYRPGRRVFARLENLGTRTMTYGESYAVQRWVRGGWVAAPDLTPDGALLWLGVAGPGASGVCNAPQLPRNIEPGRYRIVKPVTELVPERRDREHRLVAPFRVAVAT